MTGRVIHTGQVVIDLTLRIEALPEPGGDVFADEAGMGLGGGYNVLVAARRLGVETLFAGTLGRGLFSQAANAGLAAIGAVNVGARVDGDLGYCVAMTDARAERTFVSAAGAETRDPLDAFDRLEVGAEDGFCCFLHRPGIWGLHSYRYTGIEHHRILERKQPNFLDARNANCRIQKRTVHHSHPTQWLPHPERRWN